MLESTIVPTMSLVIPVIIVWYSTTSWKAKRDAATLARMYGSSTALLIPLAFFMQVLSATRAVSGSLAWLFDFLPDIYYALAVCLGLLALTCWHESQNVKTK